jgi:hypothetical protein
MSTNAQADGADEQHHLPIDIAHFIAEFAANEIAAIEPSGEPMSPSEAVGLLGAALAAQDKHSDSLLAHDSVDVLAQRTDTLTEAEQPLPVRVYEIGIGFDQGAIFTISVGGKDRETVPIGAGAARTQVDLVEIGPHH